MEDNTRESPPAQQPPANDASEPAAAAEHSSSFTGEDNNTSSASSYAAPFVAAAPETVVSMSSSGGGNNNLVSSVSSAAAVSASSPPVEMKLFVGRVPRTIDENGLRPVFAEFGVVSEIAIIKDRTTGMHKGSAFCRMASLTQADAAIRALNNIRVLDPQLGPLQVRYATGEAEKLGMSAESAYPGQDQAKLFVGSLPRNITEDEVRTLFSKCGEVDEVFIMRDSATGQGKGCAFVKFAYKEQAIHAIKTLSGVHQLPGAPRPLEVRFAESKKAMQQPAASPTTASQPVGGSGRAAAPAAATTTAAAAAAGSVPSPAGGNVYGGGSSTAAANANPSFANCNPRTAGPWKEYFTDEGRAYYHNETTSQTQWERPGEFDRQDVAGPPGANIFVFHVPNDWTQADLLNNFQPFGQIVSARIATDKATGRNKGYAFVSFAAIHSAAQAVQQMNGCMAGQKRLKVSIKQNEEIYVQHLLNQPPTAAPPPAAGNPVTAAPFAFTRPTHQYAAAAAAPEARSDAYPTPAAGGPQRW